VRAQCACAVCCTTTAATLVRPSWFKTLPVAARTSFLGSMTSFTSLSTFSVICSVSALAVISSGCSLISCSFIVSTAAPADSSCCKPLSYRRRTRSISLRLRARSVWKVWISSR
jgi:hypothetical protein